ncbi:hypothetical protein PHMEG_0004824 [Phytophthora megakarya]|uniref:RNase H type-1 domain-containing protein n=1 Tax=Phytophthora megakarya TaxID=4795 RepID=A0A225WUK1_9STRA|nr:hypothetical protein PHMEG_0004824 [Phytophthora megakarya]
MMRSFTRKRSDGAITTIENCYTQLLGRTLRVYKRFSTLEWLTKSKSLFGRAVQWAVLLSLWHLIVQRVKEKECEFTKLLQSILTYFLCLDRVAIIFMGDSDRCERAPGINDDKRCRIFRNEQWSGKSIGVRLTVQQSLRVTACRNEALMVVLNRHKEITKKFKSVKYLHVMREFNATADSLATEALESKTSKVVLYECRKTELSELNQIQEMIYDSAADSVRVKEVEIREAQSFADFVQIDTQAVMAITRSQSKTQKKHVRFADEQQKTHKGPTSGAEQKELNAEDFDPVVVQAEWRRRIATAQDEELKWCNLKKMLRGEADKLKYRVHEMPGKLLTGLS